jgi:hypothetical protein
MDFPGCTQENENTKIPIIDKDAKNKKSKLFIENPKKQKFKIVEIEDCVIQTGKRCDWLVISPSGDLVFIELKGNKVEYAIQQIENTLSFIRNKCSLFNNRKITCIISCTRCPLSTTDIQNHKVKFKKKYKASLLVKTGTVKYKT